jgi:hypothetical protein
MNEAPPIISPLEFAGISNRLILIECDEEDNAISLLRKGIENLSCVFYTNEEQDLIVATSAVDFILDDISKICRMIKRISNTTHFHIIHRIDLMNLSLSKKARGSQIKGHLSMLSPRVLLGSNVIVTSCRDEYSIREIADVFINLRK